MSNLVVFDFDETMIIGNIDIIIFHLKPYLHNELIHWQERHPVWTDFMAYIFKEMHSSGVTKKDMENTLRGVCLFPSVLKICQFLGEREDTEFIVLSDANNLFIRLVLEANNILHMFNGVYSNPAEFTADGRVSISHYHKHACDRCPANLCKGTVLQQLVCEKKYSRVVYLGDGHGDVCPCLSLSDNDVVFAREGYPLAKELQKSKKGGGMKASLHTLDFATEILYEKFCSIFSDKH